VLSWRPPTAVIRRTTPCAAFFMILTGMTPTPQGDYGSLDGINNYPAGGRSCLLPIENDLKRGKQQSGIRARQETDPFLPGRTPSSVYRKVPHTRRPSERRTKTRSLQNHTQRLQDRSVHPGLRPPSFHSLRREKGGEIQAEMPSPWNTPQPADRLHDQEQPAG
jgi:hypothetical protein